MIVKWRAAICDDADPFTAEIESLLYEGWAMVPANGKQIVEVIAADYFRDPSIWYDLFGNDRDGRVEMRVAEPDYIAGNWTVRFTLEPKVSAERCP